MLRENTIPCFLGNWVIASNSAAVGSPSLNSSILFWIVFLPSFGTRNDRIALPLIAASLIQLNFLLVFFSVRFGTLLDCISVCDVAKSRIFANLCLIFNVPVVTIYLQVFRVISLPFALISAAIFRHGEVF
jgi:hypothetical protein